MKKGVYAFLSGVLLARCQLLSGMFPFSAAAMCVISDSKILYGFLLGSAMGVCLNFLSVQGTLMLLLPLVLLSIPIILLKNNEKLLFKQIALFASYLIITLCINAELYDRVLLMFSAAASICIAPLFKRIKISFLQIKMRLSLEKADIMAIACIGAFLVLSLPKTDFFGIDIAKCALLFSSCLACIAFGYSSCLWTSVCAIVFVIKGGDAAIALTLVAGGIFSSLLRSWRGGVLLGFVLADAVVSLFFLNTFALSLGILNILIGCAFTVFLPQRILQKIQRLAGCTSGVSDIEMSYIEGLREKQSERIRSAAVMYEELYKAFTSRHADDEFKKTLLDNTMQVCSACKKSEYCLKARGSDTVLELKQAIDNICYDQKLYGLPLSLCARCIQPAVLLEKIQREYQHIITAHQHKAGSEAIAAMEMKNISQMLFALAQEVNQLPQFDHEKEAIVHDVLSSRLPGFMQVVCRKKGNTDRLYITVRENKRDIRQRISTALEEGFLGTYHCISGGSDKNGNFTGIFAQTPRYSVKAYACRKNKQGERVCGDSYTLGAIDNEKYLAAISDGAGSGERAAQESENALDLLETLTNACMSRYEIFKTMNQLLLLKGENDSYSTVDAAEFDLEAGILYWTKLGACPGYILRGRNVEKIEAEALPAGIISKIDPSITKKLIQNGDTIVLVSDGVYDGLCKGVGDEIKTALCSLGEKSEREIAEELMQRAQEKGNDDDMTVMVVRVVA